jgi:membrane protein
VGTGLQVKSEIDAAARWAKPMLWGRLSIKAFSRSWGRDVMLYTGGVSFFALLAVFPAIAILIGFYKAVLSISQVSEQAAALADVMPTAARAIFEAEIARLANASARTVSAQSFFAVVIGGYAAHRGFKALLAGLNLIHDEKEPHGFFKFNLLAFFVALAAFLLFTVVSGAVVTSRLLEHAGPGAPATGSGGLPLDGLWPALGLAIGLTMLYRYAMSHRTPVAWAPSIAGGLVATVMSTVSSWLCAIYVEQIAPLGATYGSVGAVVVLLIWLSWNVNAIFYGGAFATEMEIAARSMGAPKVEPETDPGDDPLPETVVRLSERRASRR